MRIGIVIHHHYQKPRILNYTTLFSLGSCAGIAVNLVFDREIVHTMGMLKLTLWTTSGWFLWVHRHLHNQA